MGRKRGAKPRVDVQEPDPRRRRAGRASTQSRSLDDQGSGDVNPAIERQNLQLALKRVKQNKGRAGIDGMTVGELSDYMREHWPRLRERLLTGRYQPAPVKRVAIPKPGGGERELGIPTVLDRFIQQALLQLLQPRFDPTFSEHSHGFRPGRGAHGAVREAQRYVQQGKRWVVDVDLEKLDEWLRHRLRALQLKQ